MPFTDRLIHSLAIVTPTHEVSGDLDEYGHPVAGDPDVDLVSGLVQPKSAREIALTSQAGAQVSDHVVFLPRSVTVRNESYIRFQPDDGDRFEVVGIRDFNFGGGAHLEVDCRRIASEVLVTS